MLETEEVDQDYFTPAASTSLANIFDNSSKPDEGPGNKSLKYTPPKPQGPKPSQEEKAQLVPVFQCFLIGYLWVKNVYSSKGKIGCSILKVTKDPQRDGSLIIVLYDSNKRTLSSISLTNKLKITVKQTDFISFYESHEKFWSLNGTEDDIKKIIEHCKSKNVQVNFSEEQVTALESNEKGQTEKSEVESDMESEESGTMKAKATILSRMANMGKSVLPHPASNEGTVHLYFSSSDEERDDSSSRHIQEEKSTRRNVELKKEVKKKVRTDPERITIVKQSTEDKNLDNDELLSLFQSSKANTNNVTTNNIDLFITEQRINNSELRINMNRVNDKVDKLLTKVNDIESKGTNDSHNVNTEILLKLLKEYENKNKMYEEMLKQKAIIATSSQSEISDSTNLLAIDNENNILNAKIMELETILKQKDQDILSLNSTIEKLKQVNEISFTKEEKEEILKKISNIDESSLTNFELLEKIVKQNEQHSARNNDTLSNQIKTIMNDTFHGITEKIDRNDKYSGEEIRNIVENVIRNVTLDSLKNLKGD